MNKDLEWYAKPVDYSSSSGSSSVSRSNIKSKRPAVSNKTSDRRDINRKKELDEVKAKEREMMKRAL